MSIARVKPFPDLYAEVEEYEYVIVPDRPYARALNRQLDRPTVGRFAITPRQFVEREAHDDEDRRAFIELLDTIDLPWKQTAHLLGDILQCWEHRGTVDAILQYDRFDTPDIRQLVASMADLKLRANRLERHAFEEGVDVAVIGEQQLTPLQRSILPRDYDSIDPFVGEVAETPEFRIFDTTGAIVDVIVESTRRHDPNDIAVVVAPQSPMAALVEATLDAADISYHGGPGFADIPHHRGVLRLFQLAHRSSAIRVRDIRPILPLLEGEIDIAADNRRLETVTARPARWIDDMLKEIPELSFREAIDRVNERTDRDISSLTKELDEIGMSDAPVSNTNLDRVLFYFETFDIPLDQEQTGLALASATAAGYVDRPLVFLLGIDQAWTRPMPARPWIDRSAFYRRDLDRFQLLLQSGASQQYLVQERVGGKPVVPCQYLQTILDTRIERFSDIKASDYARPIRERGSGFAIKQPAVTTREVDTISQSALGRFVHSPREYMFDRLLESPQQARLREGSLLHDFAEFVVANPAFVDEDRLEECVTYILDSMHPFYREEILELRRSAYRASLEVIVSYLETSEPTTAEIIIGEPSRGENEFATHFDRPIETNATERWFEDDELGIKGKIDLVQGPDLLTDFKSGTARRATEIVPAAAVDPPAEVPDFQAIMYLTYLRAQVPDRQLRFRFLFIREVVDDVITGSFDPDEAVTEILYRPVTFETYLTSDAMFRELCEEAPQDATKTFSQLEYHTYRNFIQRQSIPDSFERDSDATAAFCSDLEDLLVEEVGEYKYVKNAAKQAIRYIRRTKRSTFFADDLDAFETFVHERIDELNRYCRGEERFPVTDLIETLNDRRLDHQELLLTDA